MNAVTVSFTHLLNPFPAKPGSEHQIASSVTYRSLHAAQQLADQKGLRVDFRAVILPGDEGAVAPPIGEVVYLKRTVQDLVRLTPKRPLPLIEDILKIGAEQIRGSHLIFSNMDIAVQPHFYTTLHDLICHQIGPDMPFTVPRVNIDAGLANEALEAMYRADGPIGQGYDCFVIPRELVRDLDLGGCCIGAPYFDNLLVMELDAVSRTGFRHLVDQRLTFHLGCDIAWAAMINYVEHNLGESLAAIARMRRRYPIADGSFFDRNDKWHFQRNATLTSAVLRKVRRIPGVSTVILKAKRAIGRQY